jgi:hypothetical protein
MGNTLKCVNRAIYQKSIIANNIAQVSMILTILKFVD